MSSLPDKVRSDFPILGKTVNGHPLVYLDTAATALKPRSVIDAVEQVYGQFPANVHRGVHTLSREATAAYEGARGTVRSFLNAARSEEIVFTSGTTGAINLVAHSWGALELEPGDEVILSHMEHHSNIVPWKMLCDAKGLHLKIIPVADNGELFLEAFRALLGPRTKLVSIVHASNMLGTVNPIEDIIRESHAHGAKVLVDAAQSAPCLPLDVQALDCDFLAFSGHKLFGPTGIGVLYAKADLLEMMPPFMGGGDMILSVSFDEICYNKPPYRFEAGTPNIAGAVGLGRAIEYVLDIGFDAIWQHEQDLLEAARAALEEIDGVRIIGTAPEKVAILSFVIEGVHPHDTGSILDSCGVAIRAGHHCTQPLMARFGVPATARAAFSIYNTMEDVKRLASAVRKVQEIML
ncbi:aminotransferase class V-fold PLP-dependent enzyme [Tichowtungia aerotolerans]|uniref:Cysteine desulfurase n=1 Tax=Tichowtungia aerotolerans TaxID=2697043 RepID=A0A6P1MDT6_9BACT|nr:cysteine desulfurase [Tichowtungia aerotolerans]QHI69756.1 SufS family cysteine desulfurase [Tichowtungia aerotolerans]